MSEPRLDFDVLVVGSGPAGQRAAVQAAKLGARVGIVERREMVGGVCTNTGTIPSKTLRAAVMDLTGMTQKGIYGDAYRVKSNITVDDLFWRTQQVISREQSVIRDQLQRNGIEIVTGTASFVTGPNTMGVSDSVSSRIVSASNVILAVGTRPARPKDVDFDGRRVLDSDGILQIESVPSSMVVVGAGVIGIEYASIFACLGTRVTVVETRPQLLDFLDREIVESLQYQLRDLRVAFRFGETVTAVDRHDDQVVTHLASGKRIPSQTVLYAAGRQGATDTLNLESAGLEADSRGRIAVDEHFRTSVPTHLRRGRPDRLPEPRLDLRRAGPAGRAATRSGRTRRRSPRACPLGIYTIPEISMIGRTEEQLTDDAVPFVVGHRPLPRARPRPDRGRQPRHAQARRLARRRARCWASTSSARPPRSSSTSARP